MTDWTDTEKKVFALILGWSECDIYKRPGFITQELFFPELSKRPFTRQYLLNDDKECDLYIADVFYPLEHFDDILRGLSDKEKEAAEQEFEREAGSCFTIESLILNDYLWITDNKEQILKAILTKTMRGDSL